VSVVPSRVFASHENAPSRRTLTFVFTDIEGSTERWERDRDAMASALRRHDELVREAILHHHGHVFKTVGDGFCAAFGHPPDAVAAVLHAQHALANEDFSALGGMRMRVAIHTGVADERDGDFFGPAVNRIARLLAIAHGGQVLLSGATAAIAGDLLPQETRLLDLGGHRLKDLTQPEHVYQLHVPDLPNEFPPLRSLNVAATNLPLALTTFIGRETEIEALTGLVREHRLVTLVGAGGVGKTRLALHLAAQFVDSMANGVWLIELAPLTSGEFIPSTIAAAIGVTLPTSGDPLAYLVRSLQSKEVMLVFDNCEHLIDDVARVTTAILQAASGVRIVATSRQALSIAGERAYRLPSLDVEASAALFCERARDLDERFTCSDADRPVLLDICHRLDGIPLAIELAASRTSILSLSQLAQRLHERFRLLGQHGRDRLERQQTLRALIDWSFDLLDENERAVFRRLSTFAGSWTLAAAVAVCADEQLDEWAVIDLLAALEAKSLIVVEAEDAQERRYRMLATIREYAKERSVQAGEDASVSNRHARYYAEFVRDSAPLAEAMEDERWQARVLPELDNLRVMLEWSLFQRRDPETARTMLAHVEWPELVVTPQEAIRWFEAAAQIEAALGDVRAARVLRHLVRLEWFVGRSIAQREPNAQAALDAAIASSDVNEVAFALTQLASCRRDAKQFDDAEELFARADRERENLSPLVRNTLLRNWAICKIQTGDAEEARKRCSEVARLERAGSEAHASALLNLGELEFAVGNVEAACDAARTASATYERLNAAPLALATCNLAAYAMAIDDYEEARRSLRKALALLRESGARWITYAFEHCAVLAGFLGDSERAATLLGFADARIEVRQTTEQFGYNRLIPLLRDALGEDRLRSATNAGSQMSDTQALELALEIVDAPTNVATPPAATSEE
jgi:predicted ATPase/class 3 adenylate cyclase